MAFRSAAGNASRSFAQASGASHTPLLHSSSSIYDNDDETEAELAAMMRDDDGEEQDAHQYGGYVGGSSGMQSAHWGAGPDEYGFIDPPSPSPTAPSRLPLASFSSGTARCYQPYGPTLPGTLQQATEVKSSTAFGPPGTAFQGVLPAQVAFPRASAGPKSTLQSNEIFGSSVRGQQSVIKPMPVRPRQEAAATPVPSFGPLRQAVGSSKAAGRNTVAVPQQAGASQQRVTDVDEEDYWRDDPFDNFGSSAEAQAAWDAIEDICAAEEKRVGAGARAGSNALGHGRAPTRQEESTARQPSIRYLEDLEPGVSTSGSRQQAGNASQASMKRQGIKLKPVSSLPDMFRSLWRFGVFNAVQSICFETVYGSDEHVVVSAPTGAGKTVLFELAILRTMSKSASSESKVLYMAPTKSLCSERVADWKKKFEQAFGWTVQELTGDSDTSMGAWRDVAKARIIVTTPEKWDAMTRKWHDHGTTLGQLRLFCIDEVHSVGSDRGAVLEAVVSRMKTLGTSTRFVAVSATVPNIADVAEWLGSGSEGDKPAKVFQFGDDFRPCKLQKVVVGYPKGSNDFAFAVSLNFKLYDLIKQYSSGKPVLVFCNTRKGCMQAAEALLKAYKESAASSGARPALAWPKPVRNDYKTGDKSLSALLEYGIAVHHAGMEVNDRKLIERLFTDGGISIVCSTSTLAVGVNLPARMVIIKGTKAFVDGQMRDYTDLDILQMIGRAGRPQFDTLGIAVIMTEKGHEGKYSDLVNAQTRLESCLHMSLTEHVNSEIALGTIDDIPSALHWLRSTFLFVRITKNCAYYGLGTDVSSSEERLEEICLSAVNELVRSGVVERDGDKLAGNQFGDIMSKFYISHQTFLSIKTLPTKSTMRALLEVIAGSKELSSYRFRQGEKSVFVKLNKNLKFPVEKVASTADRVMVLLQLVLDGVPGTGIKTDNINPMLDARAIFVAATRIAKCMVDVAVEREDGGIRTMLELLRSLNGRCWDSSSLVLRQLEGIGEKGHKVLAASGVRTFDDVRDADADRLQVILSRKPPFGHKLISQARSIPQFEVEVLSTEETSLAGEGVQLDVSLVLRLKQSKPLPVTKRGGLKLWATVATTTTDSEFVDFRRARLDQLLAQAKEFSLAIILVKPSQKVVVSVSCDSIAGSEVCAVVRPKTQAAKFPLPSLGGDDSDSDLHTSEEKAHVSEVASAPAKRSSVVTGSTDCRSETYGVGQRGAADSRSGASLAAKAAGKSVHLPTRRRGDGKYDCNHACGDKTKCKHLCCREGLDKPPAARKRQPRSALPADDAEVAEKQPRQLKRLQPLASDGVRLSFGKNGKAKTKQFASDGEAAADMSSLSSEGDDTPRAPVPGKPQRGASNVKIGRAGSQLNTDIFASPSPSPPVPAKTYSRAASVQGLPDAGKASPAVQVVGSAASAAASSHRPNLRLRSTDDSPSPKRRRLSLRDFASSSPEMEPVGCTKYKADAAWPAAARPDALFRSQDSYSGVTTCFDDDTSGDTNVLEQSAIAQPADSAHTTTTAAKPSHISAPLPIQDVFASDSSTEAMSHTVQELSPPSMAEEDDDFDAWLESSVVVV